MLFALITSNHHFVNKNPQHIVEDHKLQDVINK